MHRMVTTIVLLAAMVLCTGFRNKDVDRVYTVGIMITDDTYLTPVEGFKQAMKDLGYLEGKHITYDVRNAKLDKGALKGFAQEFAKNRVDLIFTATYLGASMAKEATEAASIPWCSDRPEIRSRPGWSRASPRRAITSPGSAP